jgi:predicted ArsR family transcriptional regulator
LAAEGRLDRIDRRILEIVQEDASLTVNELAEAVALSQNACWRRLKRLDTHSVQDSVFTIGSTKITIQRPTTGTPSARSPSPTAQSIPIVSPT